MRTVDKILYMVLISIVLTVTLMISVSAWSTDEFNNSLKSQNISVQQSTKILRYIKIPEDTFVTKANFTLTGFPKKLFLNYTSSGYNCTNATIFMGQTCAVVDDNDTGTRVRSNTDSKPTYILENYTVNNESSINITLYLGQGGGANPALSRDVDCFNSSSVWETFGTFYLWGLGSFVENYQIPNSCLYSTNLQIRTNITDYDSGSIYLNYYESNISLEYDDPVYANDSIISGSGMYDRPLITGLGGTYNISDEEFTAGVYGGDILFAEVLGGGYDWGISASSDSTFSTPSNSNQDCISETYVTSVSSWNKSQYVCVNSSGSYNIIRFITNDTVQNVEFEIFDSYGSGEPVLWNYSNELKSVNYTIDFYQTINDYISQNSPTSGYYYFPILFYFDTAGTIEYSAININNNEFIENQQYYTSDVFETSNQNYTMEIQYDSDNYDLVSRFYYNGSLYSATRSGTGDTVNVTSNIDVPPHNSSGEVNMTFYWNLTLTDKDTGDSFYRISDSYNQTVNELDFGLCSASRTVPLINFTMYDELTGTQIDGSDNATTFQAIFYYSLSDDSIKKNYTINNISTTLSEFDFCLNNYTSQTYTSMNLFYTASGYSDKNYYLVDAELTNDTSETPLYLLTSEDSVQFFVTVRQDLEPLVGAKVNVDKYFSGEGVYKTVEIENTDNDGGFTSYLELDKEYRFTIVKDGELLGIVDKTSFCQAAPCTIDIDLTSQLSDMFSELSTAYAENVLYNLSYNPNTKIVTFQFLDTTGLANYFRMVVTHVKTNTSSDVIYENILYTSSGEMTFNATGYNDGDYKVETFISRSPEKLIDFITFTLNTIAENLGLIAIFLVFLVYLVIVFGFITYYPTGVPIIIPFGITLIKYTGLLSLSLEALTVVWVLGIITFMAINSR